jgi:hypothetical protein
LADGSVIHCPLCGNKVPAGVSKCPVCATEIQRVSSKRLSENLRSELLTEDFLHREIPRVVLPEAKHNCPLCALELKGTEAKCPRCGVPLSQVSKAADQEMLECPECGSLASFGSKSCPKCGVGFEEAARETPSVPPAEELPSPPGPLPQRPMPEIIPAAPPRAQALSSQGLVNGRGAVNGTGLVNGTGMINGTRGETRLSASKRQRLFVTRWQFLAILFAIVIIVPTFVYLSYSHEAAPFNIDGDFGEWSRVDTFSAFVQSGASSIDISEWAAVPQSDQLFMYLRTEGPLMAPSDVSSFYLFVDADNVPTTGYSVSGIGAEYLLEVDGWNNSVQSTSISEYSSGSDKLNWNSWESIGSMSFSASGNQLEAMATMPSAINVNSRFMLISQNSLEQRSMSYTVPAKGGLLVIRQEPGPAIGADGTVAQSASSAILRLHITCDGADGTVNSVSSGLANLPLASSIGGLKVYAGAEEDVDVMVDTSGAAVGSVATANMAFAAVDSTFADVEIIGEGVAAYVASAPFSIVIDGAFGDWNGLTTVDSDSVQNTNSNIDIGSVGAVNDTTASYFYVSVLGEMCSGSYVPILKEKPSGGGGGGVVIPTRKTGEDILNIYIDSDMSTSTGELVSISSKLIGADYKVEVRGLNGNITSRSLLAYAAGHWNYGSGVISAAKDLQRLELSISSSSLNGASSIDYIIETTDWRGRTDIATSVPQGTRAFTGGIPTGASLDSWVVDAATTSSAATAMSYQRKLFYDGVNFWSFYFDGTNTVYKWSNTSGQTWSTSSRAFSTAGVNEASVWYNSATYTVYIVGDDAAAARNVHVRQGTVTRSPAGIAWSAADQIPTVSSVNLAGKNTYISQDSSGYMWILASNQTGAGSYDLSAFRSRTVNTTTTAEWFCTGNMIAPDATLPNVKGSIVPASGGMMWAVYAYSGNVAARNYTGTWSPSEALIYDISASGPNDNDPSNTDSAPPSVVVDGKGVVHVLYGNGHNKKNPNVSIPHVFYAYFNGGAAWNYNQIGATAQTTGNLYPTISLDVSTGNVFAFWIETDTTGSYHSLICKKNTTGTWISWSLSSDTTYAKQYLTSIYSAPNENMICWQWTQNTTASLEVQFDKIPEFKDVAVPVVMMIGVFMFTHRRRKSHECEDPPELRDHHAVTPLDTQV